MSSARTSLRRTYVRALGTPRLRRRLATACVAACAAGYAAAIGAGVANAAPTPQPAAPPPAAAPGTTLPSISTKDTAVEVRGKILRSTRGHPGPVRLQVEKSEGGRIDVLVAPDELCNRLGLSLQAGEEVHVRGVVFNQRAPIVVASVVVVDGKEIPVRNRGPAPGVKSP